MRSFFVDILYKNCIKYCISYITFQSIEWNACGEDVNYGVHFAQEFVDVKETYLLINARRCLAALNDPARSRGNSDDKTRAERDCKLFSRRGVPRKDKIQSKIAKIEMNLHNNAQGREAAKNSRRLSCKCHGVSGSCASKTCWYEVPRMEIIGQDLMKKYRQAQRVTYKYNSKRNTGEFTPKARPHQKPDIGKKLVFISKSPDFCTKNPAKDILGTTGRECNINSTGPDSCEKLCCNRGVIVTHKEVYF